MRRDSHPIPSQKPESHRAFLLEQEDLDPGRQINSSFQVDILNAMSLLAISYSVTPPQGCPVAKSFGISQPQFYDFLAVDLEEKLEEGCPH